MISHKDGAKNLDGQFKTIALAKAPNLVSSGLNAQELQRAKVTSSITRKLFLTSKVAPPEVSDLNSSGSPVEEPPTSGIFECLDHSSAALLQQKPFPQSLMELLSQADSDIVSWLPSGTAFLVRCPKRFVDSVLPKFFKQTKLTSFHRQLNLYGFRRIVDGPDMGAYQHVLFRRDEPELCRTIQRKKRSRKKAVSKENPSSASWTAPPRVSPVAENFPQDSLCPPSIALPSCTVYGAATNPSCSTLQHPFVNTTSEVITMPSPSFHIPPSVNHAPATLTGYSILVCDHETKNVAEVSHYSAIPCDIEVFAQSVGTLLAHGIENHNRNNI
jgi:hypothetical protein